MQDFHGKIDGPCTIEQDLDLHGMIVGDTTVAKGITLIHHGMITGDLTIRPNARVIIHGMVNGTVRNEGGTVEVYGIVGDVSDTPGAHTQIMPIAIVERTSSD